MDCITRDNKIIKDNINQDKILSGLYSTIPGRLILKVLTLPFISKTAGRFLDSKTSCLLIDSFIKNNNIDMHDYVPCKYNSYNDFFTRKIIPQKRPINLNPDILISPSDGKVSVYNITKDLHFKVKNTIYSVKSLLRSNNIAKKYKNGYCVIIRLTVDNYHRYCNVDNGSIKSVRHIDGVLHTVNPIANDYYKIYKENTREYSIIDTENFGQIIQMEVGALMVGRIINTSAAGYVEKGTEKGRFEFGGSTIILLLNQNHVSIDNDLIQNTINGYETTIKYGEKIGHKI